MRAYDLTVSGSLVVSGAVLVKAIQELSTKVDVLEKKLSETNGGKTL